MGQDGKNRESCSTGIKRMKTQNQKFQSELENDIQSESRLLIKELFVLLLLVLMAWTREAYLHGLFNS